MPNVEMELEQILDDEDWAQVFADENYGNVSKKAEAVPPGSSASTSPVSRIDIEEVFACVNGYPDGDEWLGLFLIDDGRWLVAKGGCDYTGWD